MVGAPGAGKGTQAALLSERLGITHIASGDIFRDHMKRGTELGRKVKSYMESGALVPDDLTTQLIGDRLSKPDTTDGVILDGFPRTRRQAEVLDTMLTKQGGRVAAALYVDVKHPVLMRRLSGRWLCTESADHVYHDVTRPPKRTGICDVDGAALYQRDDDRPETIQARLEQQLPPMFEVVDYYTDRDVLSTVDGDRPMAEVTEDLLRALALPAR